MKDILNQYIKKEVTAIQVIRDITGILNPEHAVPICAVIQLICRHEQGDLDTEMFKQLLKIKE